MNLNKEQIIEEIKKGSEVGKQILETEISYYKGLVKEPSPNSNSPNTTGEEK